MDLWIPGLLLALLAALLLYRSNVRGITVFDYQRALRYRRGRLTGVLLPGFYRYLRRYTVIETVDMRVAFTSVPGQEVLSADGVPIKASLTARYQIADPVIAVSTTEDYRSTLYLELQLGLRAVVSELPVETLLEQRTAIGPRIRESAAEKARQIGIDLLEVEVKDLTLPGELKKLFAQVVKARQEGLAALEKARGETAALRNLANAAQLVERNPHLLQLRVLQTIANNPSNTVVLGMPAGSGFPIIRGDSPQLPEAEPEEG